jgi:putative oxidoreductase
MSKLLTTHAAAAVIIIRLMAEVGAGRFAKIGIPSPEVVALIVACFEIGCGALVLAGAATRLAVLPLVAIMLTAIAMTKVPILMEHGFWKMAHESRTDWSMLLGSIFLLIVGAGPWSLDAHWTRNRQP